MVFALMWGVSTMAPIVIIMPCLVYVEVIMLLSGSMRMVTQQSTVILCVQGNGSTKWREGDKWLMKVTVIFKTEQAVMGKMSLTMTKATCCDMITIFWWSTRNRWRRNGHTTLILSFWQYYHDQQLIETQCSTDLHQLFFQLHTQTQKGQGYVHSNILCDAAESVQKRLHSRGIQQTILIEHILRN